MRIIDIMGLSPNQRANLYQAHGIEKVTIEGVEFTDYSAFSFLWEKSYVKSPVRSGDGSIENLNSYATFLTPHLKIDFSLMSIDSYRKLMNLMYSKNEFTVTCYDIVFNEMTTNKMYFSTEEMPKLFTIVEALNGNENAIELLAVQDYSVEMVGTNNDVQTIQVQYYLNPPSNRYDNLQHKKITAKNSSLTLGQGFVVYDNGESVPVSEYTFGNTYKFLYWDTKQDGTGFHYINGEEYIFNKNTTLYAIWKRGA